MPQRWKSKVVSVVKAAVLVLCAELWPMANTHPDPVETHPRGLLLEDGPVYRAFPKSPTYRAFLPDHVDLSKSMPPVGNQGNQGSCTGWAIYAARSYYAKAIESRDLSQKANRVSPAYIYDSIRSNPSNCDQGSTIPNALNLLTSGAVSLRDYPYDGGRCTRPPDSVKAKAWDFKIKSWVRVEYAQPDQIKAELYHGNPVLIAFFAPKALDTYDGHGVYQGTSSNQGGEPHAVAFVGYDERKQAFRAINSWGTRWGDRGYFWISYDATTRDVHEAYAMRFEAEPKPIEVVPRPQPEQTPDLPAVGCGRVSVQAVNGKRVLSGFVGEKSELDRLTAFAERMGVGLDVDLYPWPQCEVANTLADISTGEIPEVEGGKKRMLSAGDALTIDVRTPNTDSFVSLTYIQADGTAVNLTPPDMELKQFRPNTRIVLGDGSAGKPLFRVKPPFGHELLIAVSSKSPLFTTVRPPVESDREFLSALRRAVLYGKGGEGGRNIAASFQIIETTSNNPEK
jgi:Papain family cysteine protease